MLAVDPIGAIRGAPAPRTPEELARTIPGDRLLALLTENGVEAPNDNQQVNPGGNPDHFAHSGEVIEGLLHLGIVPAISINLDELPAAIREAVLTVQAQAQEDAAAGHEAENDTPRPEEVAPPPQVRPRLWDREGDLEGENVGELLRGDPSEFMRMAIYGGQLNVMEWLFRNGYVKDCFLNVWAAIDKDHLDLLEWLIEHKLLEAGRAMEAAATRCRLDMAKHLYERYWENIRVQRYYPLTESPDRNPPRPDRDPPLWVSGDTINSAVRFGNVQLAQWLLITFNSEIDLSDVRSARGWTGMPRPHLLDEATDSLEMVKFLHEAAAQGNIRGVGSICTTAAMDQAAARNRLDVVQWLHANRTEGCTTVAMDDAASHGHLEMVQWLHDNRSEGCTTAAMDGAAIGGHLDVVKWLHENRSEGCTTAAMDEAAANGHLDVVKWLHENRSEGCTTAAMDNAAFKHLDVVKWLSENRSEGCTTKAMDTAARFGNLEVVKWLSENRMEGCTTDAMDSAAAEGHLDVVQWLSEHRTEGCTTAAMDDAAMGWNGNFDMLLFLYSQRREGCTDAIFNGTAKPDLFTDIQESDADYTCDNIHDWLVEHYPQRAQAAGA